MKIKGIIFLMASGLLLLTSCSQVGYFEGYNHKVDAVEFNQCIEEFGDVNCRNEEDKLNDFTLSIYSYTEVSNTVLFENGVRSKESEVIEITSNGEYDLSNSIYHVKQTSNLVKETNTSSEQVVKKTDYTYQNSDNVFYCFDNLYKTYEIESNTMLCSEFVSDEFSDFQAEVIYLMQIGGQSAMNEMEGITCYKDKHVYTYEIKLSQNEDNETINQKMIVQAMFTNKRCFLYYESLEESTSEVNGKKETSKTYSYGKIEYNFRNISLKSVNTNKYNLD